MKIYIGGKVSGQNYGQVFLKFNKAEYCLKRQGYEVMNPVGFCSIAWSWLHCMFVCIKNLLKCDAIFLLKDWKESRGARIENFIAKKTGKIIIQDIDINNVTYFLNKLNDKL